jgi:hypothetical protein
LDAKAPVFRFRIKEYNFILGINNPCLTLGDLCETSVFLCVTNNYTEYHGGFTEFHGEKITVMELNTITEKIIGCTSACFSDS